MNKSKSEKKLNKSLSQSKVDVNKKIQKNLSIQKIDKSPVKINSPKNNNSLLMKSARNKVK